MNSHTKILVIISISLVILSLCSFLGSVTLFGFSVEVRNYSMEKPTDMAMMGAVIWLSLLIGVFITFMIGVFTALGAITSFVITVVVSAIKSSPPSE